MRPFVQENITLFFLHKPGRNVDFWPEYSEDKRCFKVVGLKNIILNERSAVQAALQQNNGHDAVNQHNRDACKP